MTENGVVIEVKLLYYIKLVMNHLPSMCTLITNNTFNHFESNSDSMCQNLLPCTFFLFLTVFPLWESSEGAGAYPCCIQARAKYISGWVASSLRSYLGIKGLGTLLVSASAVLRVSLYLFCNQHTSPSNWRRSREHSASQSSPVQSELPHQHINITLHIIWCYLF